MENVKRLIYGKYEQDRIVSLEVTDNTIEMFIQEPDGSISSKFDTQKNWLLANKQLDKNFVRLKGDLHYKWGRQFNTREAWSKVKFMYNKEDIFAIYDPKEACMVNRGMTYFRGLQPKDVSILSFDIETTGFSGTNDNLLLISNTYRDSKGEIARRLFSYDEFQNEGEMLEAWMAWVNDKNPSIIAGHNIYGFDLPFLRDVADRFDLQLTLGRNGSAITFAKNTSEKRKDGSQSISYHKVKCYGRELIDTMFLAITYDVGRKYESYGLKKIIEQEGIRFEGRVLYDAGLIKDNYQDPVEWAKIKEYCIYDSDEALQLFDLMVPSLFYMTQSVPKSFQAMIESATGAQINAVMVRSYLQEGHSLPKASEAVEFEGAISMGNPGIYNNVFKVDVASLYPSIMLQYDVYDAEKDPKANFSTLVKTFTEERLKNKKLAKETGEKYYDDLQGAYKIFINSMYGFLGATGLIFNSPAKAAFITSRGRQILTTALQWAEARGHKIINADTDSISYAKFDESEMSERLRQEELQELNEMFPEKIHFEDDGYYKKVIVLRAKNYVLYDGKKIKTKGSALKSSKMEPACREFQQAVIQTIIEDKFDYENIYKKYIKEACNVTDIKRWSSKKTYTKKLDESERANETKQKDALAGTNYKEGDKFYVHYLEDGTLRLSEQFDGNYDKMKLVERIFKSSQVFEDILDTKSIFINYRLKKNQKALQDLLNE